MSTRCDDVQAKESTHTLFPAYFDSHPLINYNIYIIEYELRLNNNNWSQIGPFSKNSDSFPIMCSHYIRDFKLSIYKFI